MLLVTREAEESFAARFLCQVGFIDFSGARDPDHQPPACGCVRPRLGRGSAVAASRSSRERQNVLAAWRGLVSLAQAARRHKVATP